MKRSVTITAIAIFLSLFAAAGISLADAKPANLNLPQLWTAGFDVLLESAAVTADVTGDNIAEVLVAGHEEMFVLNGHGKELWRWRSPGRYLTYPTVWSQKGKPGLIFAADNTGTLTCLDGTGKVVWQAKLSAPVLWSASVLCNLDDDPTPEVIQTDDKGAVWAFNAEDGKPLWQSAVKGTPVTPAVDAENHIYLATGAGLLVALEPDGKVLWERPTGSPSPSWATGAPIAFASTKGLRVAVPSSDGRVLAFDAEGNLLWSRPTNGPVASTLSAADFDGDGTMDIFAITQLGTVHRFDETGRVLWNIDMQGRTLAPGAIADINNDGKLEYVLSTQGGNMLVLSNDGRVVFDYQFKSRTINATPAIGDISAETPGLELVVTGGESGKVFCFGTPSAAKAAAPWRMYRADASNRGQASLAASEAQAANAMEPKARAWDNLCSGDDIVFDISKAADDGKLVKASAACVRPDGVRQVAAGRFLRQSGTLRLPVSASVPGVYRFEWTLTDDAGQPLTGGTHELTVKPFVNDRALVTRALDALKSTADSVEKTLPDSTAALRNEAVALTIDSEAARTLQDKSSAETEQQTLAASAALVKKARRALRIAELVGKAAADGPGASLLVSKGDLWESRGVDECLPDACARTLTLENRVVPGEHEPVAVNLFNITGRELQVRVLAEPNPTGPRLTLHRVAAVPTAQGNRAWDPLPALDEASVLAVPALSTRQVYIDPDFADVKPGDCTVKVRFLALDGAGIINDIPTSPQDMVTPEATVELNYKVLPFDMAPSGTFRLCAWASLGAPEIKDMLAHGTNVFCLPLPDVKYDDQAHLAASDYAKTDALLEHLKGHDVMVLLTGQPALKGDPASDQRKADMKAYLDELVAHMAALGFDTSHFALYPVDEPGGNGWASVNQLLAIAKDVKAVHPDVLMYVDGGGDGAMFEAMASCIDIWTPSIYQLPDDSPEMKIMRSHGKALWSYNCSYAYARPVGPNIKDCNVVAEFRNAALFALRYGATGIGFWSYNIGPDIWGRVKDEYPIVYPGAAGPVTSRRWEAVREGIEDYRILAALKEAKDLPPAAKEAVTKLLDTTLPSIIDPSYQEEQQGFSREAIDAGNNTARVEQFRAQIMNAVALAKP
jgi:outer membrane protein assembly factor BamB